MGLVNTHRPRPADTSPVTCLQTLLAGGDGHPPRPVTSKTRMGGLVIGQGGVLFKPTADARKPTAGVGTHRAGHSLWKSVSVEIGFLPCSDPLVEIGRRPKNPPPVTKVCPVGSFFGSKWALTAAPWAPVRM